MPETTTTPYSTVTPYISGYPTWIPQMDQERIAAYKSYEDMYWGTKDAFKLIRRAEDGAPIYIPNTMTVVDTTSHYLLKNLQITIADPEKNKDFATVLDAFLKREKFYSRFSIAKHSGVTRGDWIFHITADPLMPESSRISLNSLDPAMYFPEYDEDDLEKRIAVKLVEQQRDEKDPSKTVVKILHYWFEGVEGRRRVFREEAVWKLEGWDKPEKAEKVRQLIPAGPLPPQITQIPVYHFRNRPWQGDPFGGSELKGFERIFQGIDQAISDEELALALTGLGVYATDAGRPVDENGNEVDWVISPAKVLEVPGATMFKRLEGIGTVTPVQDHLKYLEQSLFRASATSDVALGNVDVNVAESGIALAIKFMPTLAKLEERDTEGISILSNLYYDLKFWFMVYENQNFLDIEVEPKLGEKLPLNRAKMVEELNNMLDRDVISRKYYRMKMTELGYKFPENMEDEILEEQKKKAEATTPPALLPGPGGRLQGEGDTLPADQRTNNNNKSKVNESKGTEVKA